MGKMAEEMQEDEPDSPLKVKAGQTGRADFHFWLYRCGSHCSSLSCLFVLHAEAFRVIWRWDGVRY